MKFPFQGKRVLIQSIRDHLRFFKPVNGGKLKGLTRTKAVSHLVHLRRIPEHRSCSPIHSLASADPDTVLPAADLNSIPLQIQSLTHQYGHLFKEPTGLPPQREDDHHIPLLAGSQPVNIRPYR
jgi:hypothetical protein